MLRVLAPARKPSAGMAVLLAVAALSLIATAGAAQLAAPAAASTAGAPRANPAFGRATEIRLPTDAAAKPASDLYGVACAGRGDCAAGGAYQNTHGDDQAIVVTQSRGKWGRAVAVRLPANAAPQPDAEVNAVACTSPGACVAVGYCRTGAGFDQGFIVTQAHGLWGRALQLRSPANAAAESAGLESVTCTGAGSCEAVGFYLDNHGHEQGMAASETRGRWEQAAELIMPSNAAANPGTFLTGISCSKAGNCVAVGSYDNDPANAFAYVAVGVVEFSGTWRRGTELGLPGNAVAHSSAVASVACFTTGHCLGAGTYHLAHAVYDALAVTESNGHWGRAGAISAKPQHAADTALDGISCATAKLCIAAGGYQSTSTGIVGALTLTWSNGRWGHAAGVGLPANASTSPPYSFLYAVACTSDGYCAAVGYYDNRAGVAVPMATTRP